MQSHNFHFIKQAQRLPYFKELMLPSKKNFHLHIVLTSCGHEIATTPAYSHNGLKRGNKPFAFLQYTLSGQGELKYEKTVHALKAGTCILGIIPHNHTYYLPISSQQWEFVYLTFAGSEALRILRIIQTTLGPMLPSMDATMLSFFYQILKKATIFHKDIFDFSSLVYSFLMSFTHTLFHQEYTNAQSPIVGRAIQYCKDHYHELITIDKISAAIRISKFHLARIFHQQSGQTIQKFIESYRMQQALSTLIHSNQSIKSIATQCGFASAAYFTIVFKKHYRYTPSEFLKQLTH